MANVFLIAVEPAIQTDNEIMAFFVLMSWSRGETVAPVDTMVINNIPTELSAADWCW